MAQIVLPNQLTNGTVADASQVMANFQAIVDVVNGNLGSDNIASFGGDDVTCVDLNGGTSTLNTFTKRFQAGFTQVYKIDPKTDFVQHITFPTAFPDRPLVFCTFNDNHPESWHVSANNVTSTGFDFVAYNSSNGQISIWGYWLAVYIGAGAPQSG